MMSGELDGFIILARAAGLETDSEMTSTAPQPMSEFTSTAPQPLSEIEVSNRGRSAEPATSKL